MECLLSGVHQGSVLDPLLFILFTADLGDNLESKIASYADDTTLFAYISNPNDHIGVARSPNRDLAKIESCCELWGMKLNPKKIHSKILSRSLTPYPLTHHFHCVEPLLRNLTIFYFWVLRWILNSSLRINLKNGSFNFLEDCSTS